jgi:hypothetical protein
MILFDRQEIFIDAFFCKKSGEGGPASQRDKDSLFFIGGGSGIRTHEGLAPLLVFKTSAFNHSAIPPCLIMFSVKRRFVFEVSFIPSIVKFNPCPANGGNFGTSP